MGLRVVTSVQVQAAWKFKNDSQATQAFDPWYAKLVKLATAYPRETVELFEAAFQEASSDHSRRLIDRIGNRVRDAAALR